MNLNTIDVEVSLLRYFEATKNTNKENCKRYINNLKLIYTHIFTCTKSDIIYSHHQCTDDDFIVKTGCEVLFIKIIQLNLFQYV